MNDSKKILIVEGMGDKFFFENLFKKLKLQVEVRINIPTEYNFVKDGKSNAIALLSLLLKQLTDGSISHLAIVLDADYQNDHWGFEVTLKKIKKILNDNDYSGPNIQYGGLSFPHENGLNDVGLWIMPDNYSEGMLEDWVKGSIQESELPLLQLAIDTVKNIPNKKFKPIHNSKAEVATWMAWQKIPACGLGGAVEENLFNYECESMMKLIGWLKYIYISSTKLLLELPPEVNVIACEEL